MNLYPISSIYRRINTDDDLSIATFIHYLREFEFTSGFKEKHMVNYPRFNEYLKKEIEHFKVKLNYGKASINDEFISEVILENNLNVLDPKIIFDNLEEIESEDLFEKIFVKYIQEVRKNSGDIAAINLISELCENNLFRNSISTKLLTKYRKVINFDKLGRVKNRIDFYDSINNVSNQVIEETIELWNWNNPEFYTYERIKSFYNSDYFNEEVAFSSKYVDINLIEEIKGRKECENKINQEKISKDSDPFLNEVIDDFKKRMFVKKNEEDQDILDFEYNWDQEQKINSLIDSNSFSGYGKYPDEIWEIILNQIDDLSEIVKNIWIPTNIIMRNKDRFEIDELIKYQWRDRDADFETYVENQVNWNLVNHIEPISSAMILKHLNKLNWSKINTYEQVGVKHFENVYRLMQKDKLFESLPTRNGIISDNHEFLSFIIDLTFSDDTDLLFNVLDKTIPSSMYRVSIERFKGEKKLKNYFNTDERKKLLVHYENEFDLDYYDASNTYDVFSLMEDLKIDFFEIIKLKVFPLEFVLLNINKVNEDSLLTDSDKEIYNQYKTLSDKYFDLLHI